MNRPPYAFTLLGTSAAVPSADQDTTALCLTAPTETILIDCGGSPVQKLRRIGVDPLGLTAVIITHTHPDHAYGLPALIQSLILLGRAWPLSVYCREEHVGTLQALLGLFRLFDRGCPLEIIGVRGREGVEILATPEFVISGSPNAHGSMPNLAIRVDLPRPGSAVVYSSDTEPSEAVVRLARGANTLVHEATFPDRERGRALGHSTALQAGEIAEASGVHRLILTHLDWAFYTDPESALAEARRAFSGVVLVAEALHPYPV